MVQTCGGISDLRILTNDVDVQDLVEEGITQLGIIDGEAACRVLTPKDQELPLFPPFTVKQGWKFSTLLFSVSIE